MKNLKKLLLLAALTLSAATAAAQDPETDWANFGRFEAENAALAASPEVVLMGNSITERSVSYTHLTLPTKRIV